MKILHATEVELGGAVTVIRTLIESQIQHQADRVLCLIPANQKETLSMDFPGHVITYRRTGRNLFSFLSFAVALVKVSFREKPDLIHLHSSFAGMIGRSILVFLRIFIGCKIIYCPHGFSFLMDGSRGRKKVFSIVELFLSFVTDKIICVSEFEKKSALTVGIAEGKIRVVHNGVPAIIGPSLKTEDSPLPRNKLNLLFVGRLDPAKGFDTLIAAMKKLDGQLFHLTVLGISSSEVPDAARHSNISYMGWLNQDQMRPYFAFSDVLVLPSRWEGFPMVVLEAMNSSLAVVASNCTSLSESVRHGMTGYIFPVGDSDKLSEIIVTTSQGTWKELGRNGRRYYLENFTSENMNKATYDVYLDVLTGSHIS